MINGRGTMAMTSPGMTSTVVRVLVVVVIGGATCSGPSHEHGGVPMGVSNDMCDNGRVICHRY